MSEAIIARQLNTKLISKNEDAKNEDDLIKRIHDSNNLKNLNYILILKILVMFI
jgi:hypothetical protein